MKSKWTLNPLLNFDYFVKHCHQGPYEEAIFAKLADKGLSGCSTVVAVCE
jgi:hypothetical protein